MADNAIALIIAGSGDTVAEEVEDLLNDAYPEEDYEEIGLVVPVDKDMFTDAVKQVVAWYNDDKGVYPIQTKGASLGGRAASRLGEGNQEVDSFTDILTREEFPEKDWDEVHVLIAMPEDPEDPDYERYADIADLAEQAGFKVKNLCAGLDDIVVIDPEDASKDEESEPEPEKPARRRRGRATDKDEEPEAPAEEGKPAPKRRSRAKKAETIEEVKEAVSAPVDEAGDEPTTTGLDDRFRYHPPTDEARALHESVRGQVAGLVSWIEESLPGGRERSLAVTKAEEVMFWANAAIARSLSTEPAAAPEKAEEDADAPKRGRGRPRTDFDVRQVWDEDKEDWVPRPKGRLKKGTEWRTIHAETSEVLDEGTA